MWRASKMPTIPVYISEFVGTYCSKQFRTFDWFYCKVTMITICNSLFTVIRLPKVSNIYYFSHIIIDTPKSKYLTGILLNWFWQEPVFYHKKRSVVNPWQE